MSDVFQQTFLGASIVDFNINLGLGSNSSSLSVNLVPDDVNFRGVQNNVSGQDLTHNMYVNGAKEGYSYEGKDSFRLFPVSLWDELNEKYGGGINSYAALKANLYKNGDYFWAPPQGSAVFFSYFDNKRYYDFQDPRTGKFITDIEIDDTVARDYLRERWDYSVVNFGGILKSVSKKFDQSSGVTYSVDIQDPKCILEGTQVILSDHIGLTAPPDNDMFILDSIGTDAGGAGVKRKLNRGYSGSYNVLNVFGYYELRYDPSQSISPTYFPYGYNKLGYSGNLPAGLPWMMDVDPARDPGWRAGIVGLYDYIHMPGIHWALESMTGGWNASYQQTGEPFGGSLFYGAMDALQYNNNTVAARNVGVDSRLPWPHAEHAIKTGQAATNKKAIHAYRYFLDLTELRKLHNVQNPSYRKPNGEMHWGGTIDNSYYINGQSMSLLNLIQQVCDTAGADFFVSLLPGCFASVSPSMSVYSGTRFNDANFPQYSGVIKVNVIQRNRPVKIGVISKAVHDAVENHKGPWAADSTDCRALSQADCARRFPPTHPTQPLEYKAPKDIPVKAKRLRCDWNYEVNTCESIGGVQNADIGREFTDAVSNITMFGGPRTRVVGVTPIGDRKERKRIFIDQNNTFWSTCWNLDQTNCEINPNCTWDDDTFTCTGFSDAGTPQSQFGQDPFYYEYLPSTELDGVYLNGFPIDDENYRDPAYTSSTTEEQTVINNDIYVSYQWFRHDDPARGGVTAPAGRPLQNKLVKPFLDLDALNSVYDRGSTYPCSYSYTTNTANAGQTVTSIQVAAGNKRDCLSLYNATTGEFDLKGACTSTTCQFNSCKFDGKRFRVPLFQQGTNECGALQFDLKTSVQALGGLFASWFIQADAEDPVIGDTGDINDSEFDADTCSTAYPDMFNGVCVQPANEITEHRDATSCAAAGGTWVIPTFGGSNYGKSEVVEVTTVTSSQTTQPLCQADIDAGNSDKFVPNNWNLGDGFIDLYPMWGFSDNTVSIESNGRCSDETYKTEKTCAAAGKDWINPKGLIVTTSVDSGDPVKGLFNDDDPYRDFDFSSGLGAEFSYYNPFLGECTNHGKPASANSDLPQPSSKRDGHTWETKTKLDLVMCFDKGSFEATTWVSDCNKAPAMNGSPLGVPKAVNPFISQKTIYKKVHQHGCYQCFDTVTGKPTSTSLKACRNNTPGATEKIVEVDKFKGGLVKETATIPDSECTNPNKNGTGEVAFVVPIFEDTVVRGKTVAWSPDAYDPTGSISNTPQTKGFVVPKWKVTRQIKKLVDANGKELGTGCVLKRDPDPAEGMVTEVRNMGFCEDFPTSLDPESCQRGSTGMQANPVTKSADIVGNWKYGNFTRPKSATIPIDLSNVIGFLGEDKWHTVTVSELRAALVSQSNWQKFCQYFDPALLCEHDLPGCAAVHDAAEVFGQIFNMSPAVAGNNTSVASYKNQTNQANVNSSAEHKKLMLASLYQKIRSVATNNYGKTYLMPLPNVPSVVEGCSSDLYLDKATCEASGHEWGKHGLPETWVAKIGGAVGVENRWDISTAGWPGDDDALDFMSDLEFQREEAFRKQVRYPQNSNFWTQEGNLQPFVVYPQREYKRLEQNMVDIDFKHIDPEAMFSLGVGKDGNLGGKTNGKVFVQATVSPEIYWLPKKSTYEMNILGRDYYGCKDGNGDSLGMLVDEASCEDRGGTWEPRVLNSTHHVPYALITVNSSPLYKENDSFSITNNSPPKCVNPSRIKISANQFFEGEQEGVCLDEMPQNVRDVERPLRDALFPNYARFHEDKSAHDQYMRWIQDGFGCVYDESQGQVRESHNFGRGYTPVIVKVRKRFVDKYGAFIQDKKTCESQPQRKTTVQTLAAGPQMADVGPVWLPDYACTTLIPRLYSKMSTTYMPITNRDECKATVLSQESVPAPPLQQAGDTLVTDTRLDVDPYNYNYTEPNKPIKTIEFPLAKKAQQDAASVYAAVFFNANSMKNNASQMDTNSMDLAPAFYKPWYGGVPQQSNRFTWGPWGSASNFGKAEVMFDTSFHPGPFGGVDHMNRAALAKIQGNVAAGAMIASESGSVTISGLPEYKMGSPLQLYNVSGFSDVNVPAVGPYITDVSLNIGTNGISTTYRMQTQRKFGNTQEIYEKSIRETKMQVIADAKRRADIEKQIRLPDARDKK